jgi:hypothetical protein
MPSNVVASPHRPGLPATPTLAAGPFEIRTSWGWEAHGAAFVGTVAAGGIRLGPVVRIRARVLTACLVSLPTGADATGFGLYVNRGLRLSAGGRHVARPAGARRVCRGAPGLEGYVVHAAGVLEDEAALRLLTPSTLEALRRDDLGLEWEGRDLVLHAVGFAGADARARMAAAGTRIAGLLPDVAGLVRGHPETAPRAGRDASIGQP